jgi:hypothetical protein
MPDLAFVLAPRQNHFFVELVDVIRDELEAIGVPSQVSLGDFPAPRPGLVYVLVPPHEYFAARVGAESPPPELLRRTIFVCAEQPGSVWFEDNARLMQEAGAVFDISYRSVKEWTLRGANVEYFPLGYTRRWERSPLDGPRHIDVAFLGARSERRERYLAEYARSLWRWRAHLVLSDNGRPNEASGPDFLAGDDKRQLLARTRVLLNLHSGDRPYFESLRVVEAVLSGAVVVSEHSPDCAPLVPGLNFIGAQPQNLMLVAQHLLEHEDERRVHADRALTHLRDEVPLRTSVERLAAVAESVDHHAPVPPGEQVSGFRAPLPDQFEFPPPLAATADPESAVLRRALKQLKLDSILTRRRLDRLEAALDGGRAELEIATRTRAYGGAEPRVSVVVSLYDYEDQISAALDSAALSLFAEFELIVVDDASTDDSLRRVLEWCDRHPRTPAIVLHRPVNGGLARARNAGVDFARGEFVFVLDADNEIYPHCLGRLVEVLDTDTEAVFAYGMSERFGEQGSIGLLSVGGWDPRRLRHVNHIDAMALIRRDDLRELGGYAEDVRLHGWEDYDLWCKVAERGSRGHAVREILGRYRISDDSMLGSVTNLSSTDAYVALIERHPTLMTGVKPPL